MRTNGTIRPSRILAALLATLAAPAMAQTSVPPPSSTAGSLGASPEGAAGGRIPFGSAHGVEVIRSSEGPPGQIPTSGPGELQGATGWDTDAAPPEPTDFQRFVATSVGRLLPIFGLDLFASPPSTYAPVDVPPPSDYVVGAGDEIVIRAWGQVEIDVHAVVSREGTINVPRIGVLAVEGTRYDDLQHRIQAAVSRYYRNFQLSVSIGHLRSIQVFVVGHARRPGLYTVGALSTLFNALLASGGPSPTGSMRKVQLRRGDQLVGEFDLYDMLLKGDKSHDKRLRGGDVVFVPPAGSLAAVSGSVKTPAIFELRSDTSLGELLEYAGGLTTTASTRSLLLERLDQERGRVAEELPWTEAERALLVRDGDVVQLRQISPGFDNAVTLRGSVVTPLRTAWRPGLKVSDLVPDSSALISRGYWSRAAARAFDDGGSDELASAPLPRAPAAGPGWSGAQPRSGAARPGAGPQVPQDVSRSSSPPLPPPQGQAVLARNGRPVAATAGDEPPGAPNEGSQALRTEVSNLVDEVNWEYAVIERLDRVRLTPKLVPFNLGKAILERDPAHDLPLEPGDIVTVFSKKDILAPATQRTFFVRVEGEVATPGVYQVAPGETLPTLLHRIGGLTANAYLFGAEFQRESVRIEQQQRLAEIANRAQQELDHASQERMGRAVTADEAQAVRAEVDNQRRAIQRLRSLSATGRMVLELSTTASTVEDLPDIVLEDGDRLFIPGRYSTVGVFGSVYSQSTLLHRTGGRVDDYLKKAGGPTRGADKGSIYILRADGSVVAKRQFGWSSSFGRVELMPNDSIVVPEDYVPISWIKELKDWSQIFYQFGLGVAALTVLGR